MQCDGNLGGKDWIAIQGEYVSSGRLVPTFVNQEAYSQLLKQRAAANMASTKQDILNAKLVQQQDANKLAAQKVVIQRRQEQARRNTAIAAQTQARYARYQSIISSLRNQVSGILNMPLGNSQEIGAALRSAYSTQSQARAAAANAANEVISRGGHSNPYNPVHFSGQIMQNHFGHAMGVKYVPPPPSVLKQVLHYAKPVIEAYAATALL